jgi:hypothetical protein
MGIIYTVRAHFRLCFSDRVGNYDALVFQFHRMFGADSPMIFCTESPLLFVPDAAPSADRFSKKMLIIASDGCIAVFTLALALVVPFLRTDKELFPLILVIAALRVSEHHVQRLSFARNGSIRPACRRGVNADTDCCDRCTARTPWNSGR